MNPIPLLSFVLLPQEEVVEQVTTLDLTQNWVGIAALAAFVVAYVFVILEEKLHMRKSIPVLLGAAAIWAFIALAYIQAGDPTSAAAHLEDSVGEFAELFLFILVAMTYVNTMEERQVFDALRAWLVARGYSMRKLFWVTGVLTFFLSSQLDNLTTALIMGAVVITLGRGYPKFTALGCISTVVAANAGGAWSPFGDITTLMAWQAGVAGFFDFYRLFIPSVVNWLVPAAIMSFAIPNETPPAVQESVKIRRGGLVVVGLFAITIVFAVSAYNLLALPPMMGMMAGLGLLKVYSYRLTHVGSHARGRAQETGGPLEGIEEPERDSFDVFDILRGTEWDTLLFFFGIIVSVGGLATIGYLSRLAEIFYVGLGTTVANTAVGLISAIVDNIPVMYAVLQMRPDMNLGEWLLVTLTAGTGGSLLSIGSAAGVALMGQAPKTYTFFTHLKWTWAIALGYFASIWVHMVLSA